MKNVFVDSNVWIYAISDNDREKRSRAIVLLSRTDLTFFTSVQVINEVCFTLIRKFNASENFISEIIDSFYFRTQVLQPDRNSLFQASQLRWKYNLSFWDSQIHCN
jgi:predicted nucleic acid-binding protein